MTVTDALWRLDLPYTRPPLNLNDRSHYMVRSRKVRQLRGDVCTIARALRIPPLGRIRVELHYRPRDNRRRDSDNCVATLKPCLDGLRDAGVIPDDTPGCVSWSEPRIHPAVKGTPGGLWLIVEPA